MKLWEHECAALAAVSLSLSAARVPSGAVVALAEAVRLAFDRKPNQIPRCAAAGFPAPT